MRYLLALIYGVASGLIAVLLHQSIPPFGVLVALTYSYAAIWWIGRRFAGRRFKWIAATGWLIAIFRASTFGVGQEFLVQGDAVGSALLLIGTLVVLAAVAARS